MRDLSTNDVYTAYYLNQAGSGFGNIYTSGLYQKGHGIGSFLGGLFRCVFPLLKNGTAAIGSELLKSGVNILSDISKNEPVESTIKKRGKETISNISSRVADKMFGSGYNAATNRKRAQSKSASHGRKKSKPSNSNKIKKPRSNTKKTKKQSSSSTKKRREKREIFDIFA